MVTQQEIDEQVAAVEAAETKLDQAEAHHATAGSESAVAELRIARAEAHGARDKLRHLRSRYAAEQAAGRAREAAEQAFPDKERKALTKRLAAERDAAVAAIVAAEKAAAEVLAKVGAYSAAVRESAADLRGRGLDASNGQDFGGTTGGSVQLASEVWRPTDAASMLGAVMQAATAARHPRHPLAQLRWGQMGGLAEKVARDELFGKAAVR